MTVDIWVRVCGATGATAGGEEIVEVGVDEVDEVVERIVEEVVEVGVLFLFKTERLAVVSKWS